MCLAGLTLLFACHACPSFHTEHVERLRSFREASEISSALVTLTPWSSLGLESTWPGDEASPEFLCIESWTTPKVLVGLDTDFYGIVRNYDNPAWILIQS